MEQVEAVYDYLSLYNVKSSKFEGLQRIEQEEYPSYAIREALINAVVHRDYSFSGSTLIHLFTDRLEIVSVGGLVKGLTIEDIELGISQSSNPKLANVFYRIKWIESWLNKNESFTSRELEEYLNRSKGTVRKILESLMKEHRIIRVGNGPSTKYVIKK